MASGEMLGFISFSPTKLLYVGCVESYLMIRGLAVFDFLAG